MAGWHGTRCRYDPEGHLGLPNAEDVREGLIAYRSPPMRPISPATVPARVTVMTSSLDVTAFDWNKQFELSLDPEQAKEYHDETLPADVYKQGILPMCDRSTARCRPRSRMRILRVYRRFWMPRVRRSWRHSARQTGLTTDWG